MFRTKNESLGLGGENNMGFVADRLPAQPLSVSHLLLPFTRLPQVSVLLVVQKHLAIAADDDKAYLWS
jgi:hypothetical protein